MMTHNQFQKQLTDRGIDPQTSFMLITMFEQVAEVSGQLDECTKILVGLVETVGNFTALHEATEAKLHHFLRRGMPDGVEVHSVARDPSEDN